MPPRRIDSLRTQITASMSYDVRYALEQIAVKKKVSVSSLIEEACRAYFDVQAKDFKMVEDKD